MRWILESAEPGQEIEEPVEGRDSDDDRLRYSLEGADSRHFDIDEDTGQILTRSLLDFETRPEYVVVVVVSDGRDEARIEVTMRIVDVDEVAVLSGPFNVVAEENESIVLGVYSAVSPEGRVAELSLGGQDAELFALGEDGSLMFLTPPDFENPLSAAGGNIYQVTVNALDQVKNISRDVTIRITNVDEQGILTIDSEQVVVGEPVTAALADPDGDLQVIVWQWSVSRDGDEWTSANGVAAASAANDDAPSGRAASLYTPSPDDVGLLLRITVFYTDGHGAGKTVSVLSLGPAVAPAPTPTAIPTSTPTFTPTPTPAPTATNTPRPSPTQEATSIPTAAVNPDLTPTGGGSALRPAESQAPDGQEPTVEVVSPDNGEAGDGPVKIGQAIIIVAIGAFLAALAALIVWRRRRA